ncbi:MAG: hypothetical protein HUJ91_04095 [Bacteroidales bacterium]|nr:hypothetical protein [Bacteroidales bacterium]
MMTIDRLNAEANLLNRKLPQGLWRFMDMKTNQPYLVVAAKTNRGNIYTIRIELDSFPESIPNAYIVKRLRDREGNDIPVSGEMHFLGYNRGMSKICHYGALSWTPAVSLYKVYIKCRLWLEMYEQHLVTGKPIDYYLTHQQ